LLLVFEARPVGLEGWLQLGAFFGVSLFFNPTFLLGEAWGSTVCSGWISIGMDSSCKGARCTAWIGTRSLESVLDLVAKKSMH
jgi:hypothetical protein